MLKLTMNKMQPATPLSCLLSVCQSLLPPHLPDHTSSQGPQETSAPQIGPQQQLPADVTQQYNGDIHLSQEAPMDLAGSLAQLGGAGF